MHVQHVQYILRASAVSTCTRVAHAINLLVNRSIDRTCGDEVDGIAQDIHRPLPIEMRDGRQPIGTRDGNMAGTRWNYPIEMQSPKILFDPVGAPDHPSTCTSWCS